MLDGLILCHGSQDDYKSNPLTPVHGLLLILLAFIQTIIDIPHSFQLLSLAT